MEALGAGEKQQEGHRRPLGKPHQDGLVGIGAVVPVTLLDKYLQGLRTLKSDIFLELKAVFVEGDRVPAPAAAVTKRRTDGDNRVARVEPGREPKEILFMGANPVKQNEKRGTCSFGLSHPMDERKRHAYMVS
jgi:hypothetical protein